MFSDITCGVSLRVSLVSTSTQAAAGSPRSSSSRGLGSRLRTGADALAALDLTGCGLLGRLLAHVHRPVGSQEATCELRWSVLIELH